MANGCIDDFIAGESNTRSGIARGSFAEDSLNPILRLENSEDAFVLHWLATCCRVAHQNVSVFGLCCLFVAAVSVHDATLVVVNHEVISEVERNPVGKWLLEVQGGEVWLFVFLKFAGTALVCAVLVTIYQHSQRFGMITAAPLAVFQIVLLLYLTIA